MKKLFRGRVKADPRCWPSFWLLATALTAAHLAARRGGSPRRADSPHAVSQRRLPPLTRQAERYYNYLFTYESL